MNTVYVIAEMKYIPEAPEDDTGCYDSGPVVCLALGYFEHPGPAKRLCNKLNRRYNKDHEDQDPFEACCLHQATVKGKTL